ncbi:MAG TPA: tryptophan halogenase family protein [Croceibacterium sp.]|nr:tryptophan halogenase family protein [Croceibacterium sp.]
MQQSSISRIVIVGGGTAGWMAAAAFSRFLDDGRRTITLVESEEIGTIGVGEATIPPIRDFNHRIGVDEREFLAATGGTIKLGIEFRNWGKAGERYLHPFGDLGFDFEGVGFHQFWLKHRLGGLEDYFLTAPMARRNRFAHPSTDPRSALGQLTYAYHFDAGLYARFLRRLAEARCVQRVEGKIVQVDQDPGSGHVAAVRLEDGRELAGDLFIDCSGFRSLLLGQTLGVPFHDWSHWLPCDRAMAVPTERTDPIVPLTRATAHAAGWQWRIPLHHRTGNGIVYPSAWLSDDEARQVLLSNLESRPLAEPRVLRIATGVRHVLWEGNVIALGLAGGFIEPLESTAIHLVQTAITKLFWLFPDKSFDPMLRAEFNKLMIEQYEYIRDFVMLHYYANQRDDPFWREMAAMPIPDSLAHKLELFRAGGRIRRYDHDLFGVQSWAAVMLGQNLRPTGYDPLVDSMDQGKVTAAMRQIADTYRAIAERAPDHAQALDEFCQGLARPARQG